MKNLYQHFAVKIHCTYQLRGGIPYSPDVIESWIKTRFTDQDRIGQLIAQTKTEVGTDTFTKDQLNEIKEVVWRGFKKNDQGLLIEGRQLGALLKESANIVKGILGITAFKAKVAERFFVIENSIPLGKTVADGFAEDFVHAITPQGPISALKRTDYVLSQTLAFTVRALNEPFTTKDADGTKGCLPVLTALEHLLEYGQNLGIGADRSQGHGRFTVQEIKEIVTS